MKTSTWSELGDQLSARPAAPSIALGGKAKTTIYCCLCRGRISLETDFRPTTVECSHCGLKFTYDPQREQEPLPVQGLRLHCSPQFDLQHHHAPSIDARDATEPTEPTVASSAEPTTISAPPLNLIETDVAQTKTNDSNCSGILTAGFFARPFVAVAAWFRRFRPLSHLGGHRVKEETPPDVTTGVNRTEDE